MTDLPVAGFFSEPARTNAQAKAGQDDTLAFIRQMEGAQAETTLVLAGDAATPTRAFHMIDTEGAASADNLANLSTINLPAGATVLIRCANDARVVTVKHNAGGTGQIALLGAADAVLDAATKYLRLRRTGANWEEIGRQGFATTVGAGAIGTPQLADGAVTARKESDDSWSSVASAATVDLGAINSRNALITGTTTITSFGNTGGEGRTMRVRFAGALTLTHHATSLILPGGANIVTAAGDVAEFVKETGTGNWRCTDYARASGLPLIAAGGGAWTFINTQLVGSTPVASVTVTGLDQSLYSSFVIAFSGLQPSVDNSMLRARFGTSGGIHSGSNYHSSGKSWGFDATDTNFSATGSDHIRLSHWGVKSGSGGGSNGQLFLTAPNTTSFPMAMQFQFASWFPGGSGMSCRGGAVLTPSAVTSTAIDRVQFFYDTGNLSEGRITAYGIKHS